MEAPLIAFALSVASNLVLRHDAKQVRHTGIDSLNAAASVAFPARAVAACATDWFSLRHDAKQVRPIGSLLDRNPNHSSLQISREQVL